jgi:hypothetical protein
MSLGFFFTGGGSASSVLGGLISSAALTSAQGSVLPDVALSDAVTGITHYACLCVKNTGASSIANVGVYLASDVEVSKTYIAKGLTGKNSTTEQTIASATTAPVGALVFQRPSFIYSALSLGALAAGEFYHVWLKRVVPVNAAGSPKDYIILTGVES